jgi:hypothetical protein
LFIGGKESGSSSGRKSNDVRGTKNIHVHWRGEKLIAGRERLLAVSSEMCQISIRQVAEGIGEPEYLTRESTRGAEVLEGLE